MTRSTPETRARRQHADPPAPVEYIVVTSWFKKHPDELIPRECVERIIGRRLPPRRADGTLAGMVCFDREQSAALRLDRHCVEDTP